MKLTIPGLLLVLISFAAESQNSSKSLKKCLEAGFEDQCTAQLPPTADYVYLSSWDYRSDETIKIEFPVTLRRNVLYVFNICEGSGKNNMVLNLLDGENKTVSSSMNQKTKKNDTMMLFRPPAGGKYYISASFDKKEANCCLIMYGMIKKNIEQYMLHKD